MYLPPNDNIQQHDLNNLGMQLPILYVIHGDFNAHSPLWGSPYTIHRGQLIEDFISGNSVCIVNNGYNIYFHEPSKTFHAVDLIICLPILLPDFIFSVGNDLQSSDHLPLFLTFHDRNHTNHKIPWYIYDRADWIIFTLHATVSSAMIDGDIDRVVSLVIQIIRAADIANLGRMKTARWLKKDSRKLGESFINILPLQTI